MYQRPQLAILRSRLAEPKRFLQILAGPRQVGKTTLARQAMDGFAGEAHYASADLPATPNAEWIAQQWRLGRMLARKAPALMVLDEVQKIPRWSETVKSLSDEDAHDKRDLRVVLLGSSQFLMQRGLGESLAGRFELIRLPHWSFEEMHDAFGLSIEQYIFYGGYPGAAALIADPPRWRSYLLDAIIEPTLSRDVLQLARIDKPALLRRLFVLGCTYSAQILSYQKMIGQLQDVGNTTTLAHYLELLGGAWMLAGLDKFAGERVRARASSPKLLALDTALVSAHLTGDDAQARQDHELWGRLVETAVGAHLVNQSAPGMRVHYWRERNMEVDYILTAPGRTLAIEVKTGRNKGTLPGLDAFARAHGASDRLVVGSGGIPLRDFLSSPPQAWL